MNLNTIAAKQKRIQNWREFLTISQVSPEVREKITNALALLGKILADSWRAGAVSSDAAAQIDHLERELDILNERIRLNSPVTLSRDLEK